ncbi:MULTISPECIES: ATP-binding protein [unclassified Streptomyces]|uniref:AAA family ATPase n=1 Tax=unclassified Streptomyces TaxID=2593676 RepID=UPI0022578481|nr:MULTISPECIES: ATP-binding protein [unclassified Streptomyces]MCX4969475.1 ATP-binding protein [Streptomyces sp. NBC_00654]MEE1739661.1 ATP-binding protein [Streptomyces sp. BE147]
MYVSRVYVENIKSFHGPRVVDLTLTRPDGSHAGWTVLAGRNGAGKTTLLRALALALSGPVAARGLVPDFDNWVTRGTSAGRAEALIARDADFDRFTYGRPPSTGFKAGLRWRARPDGASDTRSSHRRGSRPSLEEIRYTDAQSSTARRGPWADNPVGWFCAAYGPFRRMAGGSGEVQRLMLASGPVARQASLFHEDASLAEGVAWLIEQHLRALEGREGAAALKWAALSVLGDGLLPDGYRVEDVDSEGLWVSRDGHRFPLREMSDGFRTVAALVVDLLKQIHDTFGDVVFAGEGNEDGPSPLHVPGVVIIDEIDAHLHVSWQRRIGPWLTSHFPHIQFIVTTHSPYICQAADPGGLIRLPGVEEDAAPEVVPEDLYERVVYGSGDDAILSDLFGLDTPYSVRAEHLRAEFVALESQVYEGDTSPDTVARYKALKDLLTSSPAARVHEMSAQLHRIAGEIGNGEAGGAG